MSFHIIGDQDTVVGFRFAGVTGSTVSTPEEAREAFRLATKAGGCRILILTEQVTAMLEQDVTQHRLAATPPYIVVVGDIWGTETKSKSLEALIHEAVGIKIVRSAD